MKKIEQTDKFEFDGKHDYMNREELHNLIREQQPNICQVVAYKNNKIVNTDFVFLRHTKEIHLCQ